VRDTVLLVSRIHTYSVIIGGKTFTILKWVISDIFDKRKTDPKLYNIYEAINYLHSRERNRTILQAISIINDLRLYLQIYTDLPNYCLDRIKGYFNKCVPNSGQYEETGRIMIECLRRLITDKNCKFWWLFEQDK
jgi:hypothetical protein